MKRSVGCEEPDINDHNLIFSVLKNQKAKHKIRCFQSSDWDKLLEDLSCSHSLACAGHF